MVHAAVKRTRHFVKIPVLTAFSSNTRGKMAAPGSVSPRSRYTSISKQDIEYTDVVIIGNGPSGICLSYMLSGNVPYYKGTCHPNEFLHCRLQDDPKASLLEQNLEFLSSGLEGRSPNPLALLFDALTNPDADMGMDTASMLSWKYEKERRIPHVVLGKANVGGTWQMMEGGMQTLSLGSWMQLPDLPFKEWLEERRNSEEQAGAEAGCQQVCNRASIRDVRMYYEDYVNVKKLAENFRTNTTVTSVLRVLDVCHSIDAESGEQNPCTRDHCGKFKWEVRGFQTVQGADGAEAGAPNYFCYRAPSVVLATGTSDLPNRLVDVPGTHHPYVRHSHSELEELIRNGTVGPDSDPVMIIGAGLTAADTILLAHEHKVPVAHLFRRGVNDPNIFTQLPKMLYPEYRTVLEMMKKDVEVEHYVSYPEHHVVELMQDGQVLIRGADSTVDAIIKTSFVFVLIGSRPNLSFLPHEGKHLGITPGMFIDSKHNPIDVDLITYQSVHECGLYAMGPLVGDNFVRFLRGGSLGITADLWSKQEQFRM